MHRRLYGVTGWTILLIFAAVIFVGFPVFNLVVGADSAFHISAYWVTLLGKIMCFAIVAVAMDLIWGYAGILSLGHGLFFALGGYAFGMYLMRQIGSDGQYRQPMPDFMVFLDWKEFPWQWLNTDSFLWCAMLVVVVPGVLAYVFGYLRVSLARQGRVFLDHHAGADLRGDAAVLPQRHRLRRQQRLHRLQAASSASRSPRPQTRMVLFAITGATLIGNAAARPLARDLEVRPRARRDPRC